MTQALTGKARAPSGVSPSKPRYLRMGCGGHLDAEWIKAQAATCIHQWLIHRLEIQK